MQSYLERDCISMLSHIGHELMIYLQSFHSIRLAHLLLVVPEAKMNGYIRV